ncbi:MAG: hypothetical protein LUD72_01850 [Bacteroidales bacterium]|nr:hypothetical protein [Bacteroidales bacterium]
MKGNSSYPITILLFTALLCAVSCTQEEILEPQDEKAAFAIVGNPVQVHLSIAVSGLTLGVGTRVEEPVADYDGEDTEEERHIDDLWLFEYSQSSGKLIYMPQQVTIKDQDELADIEVTLSDNNGNPAVIYAVANSGSGVSENSAEWVVEEISGDDVSYPGFMTIKDLEANTIPTPHPQRMTWDETTETYVLDAQDASAVSIPMSGYIEATVKEDADIIVPVARMFAKLLVRVDLSSFNETDYDDAWLNTVTVSNIPEYCTVKALGTSTTVTPADYSDCPRWLRRVFNSVGESSGGSTGGTGSGDDALYPYLIYVPENIQGENGGSTDKADNLPNDYALSVTAGIYVEKDGATMGEYTTFIAYPGGNTTDNFNVRRNCLYRVTLKINDLIDEVLPSANCIVCLSGETTAFFPYCRTEVGGGYDFEDYLYSGDDDAKKGQKIDHVGIIWQSTDGGNMVDYSDTATGYIGDNSNNEYVWIDEVDGMEVKDEYHRRIHVTIPEGRTGNALIGAYNSSNEIIWSWHIWSRARANDPTTVNTKLYYTYDWDSDGIYGRDSGRPRVAGYTIMNCNLGAMQDEPIGSVYSGTSSNSGVDGYNNAKPTFGTLYQWGRKDPFPPITAQLAQTNYGGSGTQSATYDTNRVGNYFDNGNAAVQIVQTDNSSALFHSVSADERGGFDEMIPLTIQNPTVFYAGTSSISGGVGNGLFSNDLTPYPYDANWLLDDDNEHYNRLWGGLDPEHDQVTKSFDTGYTCTIGGTSGNAVHLYNDYGEKSIFDPCPYGWRVSPPDLWLGFTDTGLNPVRSLSEVNYNIDETKSNFAGMTMYLTAWGEGETSFFPIQGTRLPTGTAYRSGQCGNYNNATADANSRVNTLHIHYEYALFHIFESGIEQYYVKSTAGPLRCIRIDSVQE